MFIFYSLMKKINLSLVGKALLILSTLLVNVIRLNKYLSPENSYLSCY